MTRYTISLTPVDKFFFGGDMTFPVGNDEKDEFNSRFASYIIESARFPQQTSLLGMLRFLILKHSPFFEDGHIKSDAKDEAAKLIGPAGFRVNDGHQANSFGIISKITACRLQHCPAGHNEWIDLEAVPVDDELPIDLDGADEGRINGEKHLLPDIPGYDPKKGINTAWKGAGKTFCHQDIFIEDRRLGIERSIVSGKTADNSLYKQVCFRLNKGFRFAFDAEVDSQDLSEFDGSMVSVGGDGSYFIAGIKKVTSEQKEGQQKEGQTVVLTSPAYLDLEDFKNVPFAISGTMPFRFIKTDIHKTASYSIVGNKSGRSALYQLFTAGSVFCFTTAEQAAKFTQALENKQDFRQIGYNEYKIK